MASLRITETDTGVKYMEETNNPNATRLRKCHLKDQDPKKDSQELLTEIIKERPMSKGFGLGNNTVLRRFVPLLTSNQYS